MDRLNDIFIGMVLAVAAVGAWGFCLVFAGN